MASTVVCQCGHRFDPADPSASLAGRCPSCGRAVSSVSVTGGTAQRAMNAPPLTLDASAPHTALPAVAASASPPIRITCACGKRFQVGGEHAGRQWQCPQCGHTMILSPGQTIAGSDRPQGAGLDSPAMAGPSTDPPLHVQHPAGAGLYRCVDCGEPFAAAQVVDADGEIVCHHCLVAARRASQLKNSLILSIVISAILIIAALLVHFLILAKKPAVEPSPSGETHGLPLVMRDNGMIHVPSRVL